MCNCKKIANDFKKTAKNKTIIKIESVQNQLLFDKYWSEKRTLAKLIGHKKINERFLFHGTRQDKTMSFVMQEGFRKEFNNTAAYGKGTYFARDASYSINYSPKDIIDGYKYILLCKVIIGDCTIGTRTQNKIAKKYDGTEYDSMVDILNNPSIYVIWRDYHAIPKYLIKFKQK